MSTAQLTLLTTPEYTKLMDESVPPAQNTSIFAGANKYLLLLLLFLSIFIGIQILFIVTRNNQIPGLSDIFKPTNYPTLTPFPPPSAPAAANLEFYRTIRNGQDVTTGKIVTSEYKGTLVDLKVAFDSLYVKIDNKEGSELELTYGRGVPIDSTGPTEKEIRVGDDIIVTETSDVSKTYPSNIQKIKIVKYFK